MKRVADWRQIDNRMVPLAGRRGEVLELVAALRAHQSRLITGPPGMGKTRLLAEAVCVRPAPHLLVRGPCVLHDLLTQLAGMLGCGTAGTTNVSLKAAVLAALKLEPRAVFIEDMADADPTGSCRPSIIVRVVAWL